MVEVDYEWFNLNGEVIKDAGYERNETGFRIRLPLPAVIDFLDVSLADIKTMLAAIEREQN